MKTATRENPHWAIKLSNRAPGAEDQNRSCLHKWAAKQEKLQPLELCFFLTSPFRELTRHYLCWSFLGEPSPFPGRCRHVVEPQNSLLQNGSSQKLNLAQALSTRFMFRFCLTPTRWCLALKNCGNLEFSLRIDIHFIVFLRPANRNLLANCCGSSPSCHIAWVGRLGISKHGSIDSAILSRF
jgi:hypothetical protein